MTDTSQYSEETLLTIKLQKLKAEREEARFAEYVTNCENILRNMKGKTYRSYNSYSWYIFKLMDYKKLYFWGDPGEKYPYFQIVGKYITGNSTIMQPLCHDYHKVIKVDRNKIKKLLDIDCELIPTFNLSDCESSHTDIFTHGRDNAEKRSIVNDDMPFRFFEEIPHIVFDEAYKLYSKQALEFKEFFDTYGHNLILSDTEKK